MAPSKKSASKTPAPRTPDINFGDGDPGPEPLPLPTNIDTAIIAIMEQVGYVRKKRGAQLNYSYAGEAQLIAAIRPWMVHFGVYMRVVDIRDVNEQDRPRERGGNTRLASVTSTIRFTHVGSGTYVDVVARGEGADVSDKANNKAQTGAYKYALRQTFCIETGDDPDSHSPAVPGPTRTAPPTTPRPTADWDLDEPPPPDESEAPPEAEMDQSPPPAQPPADKKASPLAEVHISAGVRAEYDSWVKKLIKRYPAYSLQKQGQPTDLPDMNHIRATAKSLGHPLIADTTFKTVLEAIAKHAAEKAGSGTATKTATKQASGGAAKRPTNDEALKRAGF